jgi:dihydrofolate synthase/folylpolyglutamate synthase
LDATNIVTPLASVITNIAFDHQQWLGDTLAKIAAEKAGIIKSGIPIITATDAPEALAVIKRIAREKNALLTTVAADVNPPLTSKILKTLSQDATALPLAGSHQKINATLALATVEILQPQIPVPEEAIHIGLSSVSWPGRLQVIQRTNGQKILLDGAHNAAGATALRAALQTGTPVSDPACSREIRSSPNSPDKLELKLQHAGSETGAPVIIFGALADKQWEEICAILAPAAAKVLTVPVTSERTASAADLAAAFRAANPNLEATPMANLAAALDASQNEPFVLITGSLYLVGEALERLGFSPADGGERGLNDWSAPKASK